MTRISRRVTPNLYSGAHALKWIVLAISIVIGTVSIYYTNRLVEALKKREKRQVDLYAKALENVVDNSANENLIFTLEEIIQANTTIPVILANDRGEPEYYRNIPKADRIPIFQLRKEFLYEKMKEMSMEHEPIRVELRDPKNQILGTKYVYYEDSVLLVQLQYYPYVQLSVIAVFVLVVFAVFNYSRLSEQNRVWVGLAKETAHQLGTPLSSLMAWSEYVKAKYGDENLEEIDKDLKRLEVITQRFSSIGSIPKIELVPVKPHITESIDYLSLRLSRKVSFTISESKPGLEARLNPELFAWVLENLCKNAVDAMKGEGRIDIKISPVGKKRIAVDVSDTGSGISRYQLRNIFKPGFTTKERGWGLGLALVKRIIEVYHKGRILVKRTDKTGTTFRILLSSV